MMTTVAALFGTLPIALGYGEGGDARHRWGWRWWAGWWFRSS